MVLSSSANDVAGGPAAAAHASASAPSPGSTPNDDNNDEVGKVNNTVGTSKEKFPPRHIKKEKKRKRKRMKLLNDDDRDNNDGDNNNDKKDGIRKMNGVSKRVRRDVDSVSYRGNDISSSTSLSLSSVSMSSSSSLLSSENKDRSDRVGNGNKARGRHRCSHNHGDDSFYHCGGNGKKKNDDASKEKSLSFNLRTMSTPTKNERVDGTKKITSNHDNHNRGEIGNTSNGSPSFSPRDGKHFKDGKEGEHQYKLNQDKSYNKNNNDEDTTLMSQTSVDHMETMKQNQQPQQQQQQQQNNFSTIYSHPSVTTAATTNTIITTIPLLATTATITSPDTAVPPTKFHTDQRVFARDGESGIYEAVIRKIVLKPVLSSSHQPVATIADTVTEKSQQQQQQQQEYRWHYHVHYLGWNSRWDRWVDESDLLHDTPTNRLLAHEERQRKEQEQLMKEQMKKNKKQGKMKKKKKKGRRGGTNKKDDHDDDQNQTQDHNNVKPSHRSIEEYCALPFTLKTVLLDDRDKITRRGYIGRGTMYDDMDNLHKNSSNNSDEDNEKEEQEDDEGEEEEEWYSPPPRLVHVLPSPIPIRTVLNHFIAFQKQQATQVAFQQMCNEYGTDTIGMTIAQTEGAASGMETEQQTRAFVESIAQLFEQAVPICLLYREERAQYLRIQKNDALRYLDRVDLYGCEYLLRLLVRLPVLLNALQLPLPAATTASSTTTATTTTTCPPDASWMTDITDSLNQISQLIVFLQQHAHLYFKARYRHPTLEEMNEMEKVLYMKNKRGKKR